MMEHMADPRAGTLAQPSDLVDVAHLVTAYYTLEPDPDDVDQQVAFGTSGHRGSSLRTAFNEEHIAATTQAICDYRKEQGYDGPAVPRARPPRPVGAGVGDGDRGADRQRRDGARRLGRRLHADAGRLARHHPGQPRADDGPGPRRRHRRHSVPQPARRRRVQVQPAPRRPGRHRRHPGDRGPRQRADPGQPRGRPPDHVLPRPRRLHGVRLHGHVRRRPAERGRHRRDQAGRDPDRRRPVGGCERRLLGRDRRAARPRPDRRQPAGRPDLALHDPRLGRQDPDGLLLAGRDGVADRAQGRLPDRDR